MSWHWLLVKTALPALMHLQAMIAMHLEQYTHDNANTVNIQTKQLTAHALSAQWISTAKEMLLSLVSIAPTATTVSEIAQSMHPTGSHQKNHAIISVIWVNIVTMHRARRWTHALKVHSCHATALPYQQTVLRAPLATNASALALSYQLSAMMATFVHQVRVKQVEQRLLSQSNVQVVIIVRNSLEKPL